MKKYAIYPGLISSKGDGGLHYVSAGQLMQLYNVPPAECVVVTPHANLRGYNYRDLIPLSPRYKGDYEKYLPKITAIWAAREQNTAA